MSGDILFCSNFLDNNVYKSFDKEQAVSGSGSLKRFKEIIRNVLGLDLNQDREWELLCDYEKVRDFIYI